MMNEDNINQRLVEKNNSAPITLLDAINADYYMGVESLIKSGTNINIPLPSLELPLHLAVRNNKLAITELLLINGAEIEASDAKGQRPLHLAMQNNKPANTNITKLLLRHGAEIEASDAKGQRPLHLAVQNNKFAFAELLLNHGAEIEASDDEGQRPLHLAVQNGRPEMVGLLLRYGANVEASDAEGCTPFHYVCNTKKGVKISKKLLEYNANINATDNQGWTPLHHAVICENKPVINYFWKHSDIDINAASREDETPLQLLAAYNIQPLLDNYLLECIDSCIGAASDEQIQYCKNVFKIVLLINPNLDKPKRLNQPVLLSELADSWDYLVQEIKNLQNKTINAEYSFHTFCLEQNPEKLKAFINNEDNIKQIESYNFKKNFPTYSNQITQNLEAAKQLHQKIASSEYSLYDICQENDNAKLRTIFSNSSVEASVKQFLASTDLLTQFSVFFKKQLLATLENKLAMSAQSIGNWDSRHTSPNETEEASHSHWQATYFTDGRNKRKSSEEERFQSKKLSQNVLSH